MSLTVLNVAFPLAPVHPAVAGGAEQVLLELDSALTRAGHESIVVACPGSEISGRLVASSAVPAAVDDKAKHSAWREHAERIASVISSTQIDVVHLHGIDFWRYLPEPGPPVLVTLHLPLALYPNEVLSPSRPKTWLHCVSASQQSTRAPGLRFLSPVENGVDTGYPDRMQSGSFALFLGRICPEKGVDAAIAAARLADIPLIIAGTVFPYPDHVRYFSRQVEPWLNDDCRFVGSVGGTEKRELLTHARCVLIPSLIEETSSLVAREALAAGTPVVAFRRNALRDVIESGRTGYLVNTVGEMALAIARCAELDPLQCQEIARKTFPLGKMTSAYLRLYARLAGGLVTEADLQ